MSQPNNSTIDSTKSSPSSNEAKPDARRVLEMLTTFYAAMGNAPEVKGAVAAMASALLTKASIEQITIALDACMFEKYPVRLPHILARIPGLDLDVNAEKRLAWETIERFASKWLRWNEDRTIAHVEAGAPELSPRILDTVRRSGGWSVYLRMTDEDFPHQQKRFFEEYEAWTEIQHVAADPSKLLEMPRAKELIAGKTMPAPTVRNSLHATPAEPISPQKARIMNAIRNVGKPRRL